ncbi:DUF992 domain-containing protein [Rhodomicrobium sp. Az07]|nr:DUF992 domain-containing protein [Rhodomicrobium sp. Az07]
MAVRAAGVFLAAGMTAAAAQPAPVGTLTCTSMPSKERAAAEAVLSCSFEGASGTKFQYSGALLRQGDATAPPGKRVYVWSVQGEREISSGGDLAGRYVGRTGGESAGILSRGRDASIVLKPPVNTSQLGDNSAISVLELNLKAVRA